VFLFLSFVQGALVLKNTGTMCQDGK